MNENEAVGTTLKYYYNAIFILNIQYHYYWALDRGEKTTAKNIGIEILKLDEEIQDLYEEYCQLKEKGVVELKNL